MTVIEGRVCVLDSKQNTAAGSVNTMVTTAGTGIAVRQQKNARFVVTIPFTSSFCHPLYYYVLHLQMLRATHCRYHYCYQNCPPIPPLPPLPLQPSLPSICAPVANAWLG
jgi:hypothetical protein